MNGNSYQRSPAQRLHESTGVACSECPWRLSNQGKRHPGGWYTRANLRRLWNGLKRGETMSCHPTDPSNPIPDGCASPHPRPDAQTTECAGALILQHRESMKFQDAVNRCHANPHTREAYRVYKRENPDGMTFHGIATIVQRYMFGGIAIMGTGPRMAQPNLNDAEIGYERLPWNFPTQQPKGNEQQ